MIHEKIMIVAAFVIIAPIGDLLLVAVLVPKCRGNVRQGKKKSPWEKIGHPTILES